jgi:hypothetical protein
MTYLWTISEVSAVFEVLCSIFDGHYTESVNYSVFDDEKGRHDLTMCVSYLKKREMRLTSQKKGDICYRGASPF